METFLRVSYLSRLLVLKNRRMFVIPKCIIQHIYVKALFILTILLLVGINVNAQGKLEVEGAIIVSDSEGVPQVGTIRFNTFKNDFEGFDGTIWKSLTGGGLNSPEFFIFSGMTCYNGLSRELVGINPAEDLDGDGDTDRAGAVVFATDFVVSPKTFDITYSINRVGDVVDQNKQILVLTCDDDSNLIVEIHRWSGLNNLGHCETYVSIQDPNGACD